MIKKVIISPDNKKTDQFFKELSKKKEELKKKLEKKDLARKLVSR